MKTQHEEEIENHLQTFKFKDYSFKERLSFMNLHRIVISYVCEFEDEKWKYPFVLFQDPFENWKFYICIMPYDMQKPQRSLYPHKTSAFYDYALEILEGSESYYNFEEFIRQMEVKFSGLRFYNWENEPYEVEEAFRNFFQAMRHIKDYEDESIEEWALRLQELGFYPITDELTDAFVAGQITDDYEVEDTGEMVETYDKSYLVEEDDESEELFDEDDEDIDFDDDYDDYDDFDEGRSPNDQRSDVMNPNNEDYKANNDNRSNQMNPNNSAYRSSRGRK